MRVPGGSTRPGVRARAGLAAFVLLAMAAPAVAQPVYKCTTPKGTVTYQDLPCITRDSQKRADTTRDAAANEVAAREMLEREAYRGNRLAAEFAAAARERERVERPEREERLRRERETEKRGSDEPAEWVTPWGWPGPPGLARPKPKSTP